MTPFDARKACALALLEASGIRKSNYQPPLLQLLWRCGLQVPPPHFASFAGTTLACGGFFAVTWGLLMWGLMWHDSGMPWWGAAGGALVAGTIFGLTMASYYALGRRRHRLPAWETLA